MQYIVMHKVENEAHMQTLISQFKDTRGVTLYNVVPVTNPGPVVSRKPGAPQPRERKGYVQLALMTVIEQQPGLCTRRLNQLDAFKDFPKTSIGNAISRGRKQGLLLTKEADNAGQGGHYLTKKGEQELASLKIRFAEAA